MWIVRLALRRPYTFVVAALLVVIVGVFTILRMPTDIFPNIDIPVVSVSFQYAGMPADEMEKRVVGQFERFLTTTVNDIEHIESQSLYGIGVIKIYFQPNANVTNATAQVTAVAQTAIRQMPPGMQPPLIIQYSASNVPIIQLSIGSKTLPEQQLFDIAVNQLRPKLITIPGVQIPFPYGGKQRQIMVDLDPDRLYAYGISPADVSAAINAQSVILPAGTAKVGEKEYQVRLNGSTETAQALNDLPIKTVNGATVYIRDVASVRDGFQTQQSKVHADGRAGVLLSIMKNGNASTLEVVDNIKRVLPEALAGLPKELEVTPMFDQSVFVRASVEGVIHEAAIAAGLTGLMILLFLGSWRSTLIVVLSIPLSILVAIIVLAALGETLNVMTLGGMALAVGILVDDATVTIENIHRNIHMRKRLVVAILDGAQQIAIPTFVATLCICIVFVPVAFISGAAKYLFTPLAMSVVFAMMTSYVISRTLVPTLVHYLLAQEVQMYGGVLDPSDPHSQGHRADPRTRKRVAAVAMALVVVLTVAGSYFFPEQAAAVRRWVAGHPRELALWGMAGLGVVALLYIVSALDLIWRVHRVFNHGFERARRWYGGLLAWGLAHRVSVIVAFAVFAVGSGALAKLIGQDFFPTVDAGQLRLHVRAPAGTRLEETAKYFAQVEDLIREVIPEREIDVVLDNIGIPNSSINLSLSDMTLIGPADGEIMVSLRHGHAPTEGYQQTLRRELAKRFPELVCYFAPSDIATQVLNFGLPASIDIQIAGSYGNAEKLQQVATAIAADVRKIPGAADIRLQQVTHNPDLRVNVDRTMADQMGLSQRDVASDLLVSLSGSGQTAPNFWLDPRRGVNYSILVQTPQYRVGSLAELENTPVVPGNARSPQETQLISNVATLTRGTTPTNATHYNIAPTYDVLMGVAGTDLGSVADAVRKVVDKYQAQLPPGSKIALRGQVESMQSSFAGLAGGLVFAVVLVYLLMVINFQSWLDPFIILMALPGALAGILWMLFATGTTVSVPALMGAIMSIGVATANSILMITFANDQRLLGKGSTEAALAAGLTRLRPVVMTALAMIIGMLPMSLGLGEGGEQNAPLGRAVIGGLTAATVTTLLLVPVVYSLLRAAPPVTQVEEELR